MVNLPDNLKIAHRGNLKSFQRGATPTWHFELVPQGAALTEWMQQLPATAATYTLCFEIPTEGTVMVGRLGAKHFPAALYLYVGSARGPGGLRARLRHHLLSTARPHWHLDYLRGHMKVRAVCYTLGSDPEREHRWAHQLLSFPECEPAVAGFGSSDCSCPAHLIRVGRLTGKTDRRYLAHLIGLLDQLNFD